MGVLPAFGADSCEQIRQELEAHKRNPVKKYRLKKELKECEKNQAAANQAAPVTTQNTPTGLTSGAPQSENSPGTTFQQQNLPSPYPATANRAITPLPAVDLLPVPSVKIPDGTKLHSDAISACEPEIQAVIAAYRNSPQLLAPHIPVVTRDVLIKNMLSQFPTQQDLATVLGAVRDHEYRIGNSREPLYREQVRRPLTYLKLKQCVFEKFMSALQQVELDKAAIRPKMIAACDENLRRIHAHLHLYRQYPGADEAARQLGQYMRDQYGIPPHYPLGPCAGHPKQQENLSRANLMISHGVAGQQAQLGSNEPERAPPVRPPGHIPQGTRPGGTGCNSERMRGIPCDGWLPESRGQLAERERRERLAREQQRQREETQRRARAEEIARQQQEAADRARRARGGGHAAPAPTRSARPDMYGALAIDYAQGRAYGWAVNARSQAEANQVALNYCSGSTSGQCQVVMQFRNTCASYAIDNRSGSTAYGWAWGPVQGNADATALSYCRQRGGPSSQCMLRIWGCTSR